MADVRDVRIERRRGPLWPAVVMLFVLILLIGFVIAMVMDVRGSIAWPAGRVEFGFRPNILVTRTVPLPPEPTRLTTDVTPSE